MINKTKTIGTQKKQADAEKRKTYNALEESGQYKYEKSFSEALSSLKLGANGKDSYSNTVAGVISAAAIGFVNKYFRDGGKNTFEQIKDYLKNNPNTLKHAQEKLGVDRIDYICGYLLGNESVVKAVSSPAGLTDSLVNNAIDSFSEDTMSLCALGLPIAYTFLSKVADRSNALNKKTKKQSLSSKKKQNVKNI